MSVRLARQEDIPQMLQIYAPYVRDTAYSFEYTVPTEEEFIQRFQKVTKQFPWLVWEQDGRVLGYAYGSLAFERAAYQWCAQVSIYLHPDIHGRGIGRKLYTILEQILRQQGYLRVYAVITSPNEASVAFHKALGYTFAAAFPGCGFKQGAWYGTVWLEKLLNSVEIPSNPPVAANSIVNNDRNFGMFLANLSLS